MESSCSSSSSSSSSSSPSCTPPRCKKPKLTTDCIKEIVAALDGALKQSSNGTLLTHLRHLLSLLQSPAAPSPALSLCASGFLQLLPPLLSHSSARVRKKSAEAVGLVAIASYEVSCRLAENPKVLSAVAQLLQTAKSEVLLNVALRSILDVATSDVGCAALLDVAGFPQQLLSLVSFLADTLTERVNAEHANTPGKVHKDIANGRLCTNAGEVHQKGGFAFLLNVPLDETAELFNLALSAVNSIYQDSGLIPSSDVLLLLLLTSLQNLWQLQFQPDGVEFLQVRNKNAPQLAKLIMRLAMQQDSGNVQEEGERKLLGKDFFQKHWELSPARIPGFSSFKLSGGPASMLASLVDAMVTCPPAVADELDPWALYKDMEQQLGLLPVLNQDIKLVHCKAGVEVPYPLETATVTSRDCIKAYECGNTVVVRGLQFRRGEVAAVCNSLAAELGQVTVGANLYLTPAASQGLGVHFDDHCVFVCQLRGCKRWSVYPALEKLPRLYSFQPLSLVNLQENPAVLHFDLQAGDVLYIPRGFLHEARTVEAPFEDHTGFASNSSEWHGASLHVSFGVEVEPAFEWEGLLHIALRLWFLRTLQQEAGNNSNNNKTSLSHVYETLLHVLIKSVGSSFQSFRKACVFLTSTTDGDAERMFHSMLLEVRQAADYQHAVEKCREEGLGWLDWLRHLPGGDSKAGCGVGAGVGGEVRESAFVSVVDRFCEEAPFLESVAAQQVLLCKFRSCRQKVVNGLLALHCGRRDCNFSLV